MSSVTPLYARDFDYAPWIEARATIGPQVYGDVYPGYTVYNMAQTMVKSGVPLGLLAPTFGAVGPNDVYADYATWNGAHGVWIAGQIRDWLKL